MRYNKQFGQFLAKMGRVSGQASLCESIHCAYKACCEAVRGGKRATITLCDRPNYSVEIGMGGIDEPIEFLVDAYDASDAIDAVAVELNSHGMSGYIETEEPDYPEDYIEVCGGWIRSDHVVVHKVNGDDTWAGMVPSFMLPYFVNADSSGLSDDEESDAKAFERDLLDDGVDVTSISPVVGPDGEFWKEDNDSYREPKSVLCTALRSVRRGSY